MSDKPYRPAIHTKGAAILTDALAFALANSHGIPQDDRDYISEFIAKINTKEAVRALATKLVPPRAVSDEDLITRHTLDPDELASLYAPMSEEQLRVRENEQQVKRIGPPTSRDDLPAETQPDVEGNPNEEQ